VLWHAIRNLPTASSRRRNNAQDGLAQQERSLQDPAVCELLKIRDFLDNVMVRTDDCYVAGFRVQGSVNYFANEKGRNEAKRCR